MTTYRISLIKGLPFSIQKAYYKVDDPQTDEEDLWRERTARMTLDALGYTNLTRKPEEHNHAVLYARGWFMGYYNDCEEASVVDNVEATFDFAGMDEHLEIIRKEVISKIPIFIKDRNDASEKLY